MKYHLNNGKKALEIWFNLKVDQGVETLDVDEIDGASLELWSSIRVNHCFIIGG